MATSPRISWPIRHESGLDDTFSQVWENIRRLTVKCNTYYRPQALEMWGKASKAAKLTMVLSGIYRWGKNEWCKKTLYKSWSLVHYCSTSSFSSRFLGEVYYILFAGFDLVVYHTAIFCQYIRSPDFQVSILDIVSLRRGKRLSTNKILF